MGRLLIIFSIRGHVLNISKRFMSNFQTLGLQILYLFLPNKSFICRLGCFEALHQDRHLKVCVHQLLHLFQLQKCQLSVQTNTEEFWSLSQRDILLQNLHLYFLFSPPILTQTILLLMYLLQNTLFLRSTFCPKSQRGKTVDFLGITFLGSIL